VEAESGHQPQQEGGRASDLLGQPSEDLERTIHWDEFPNGRWGDATSPAFGDLSDYHLCNFRAGSVEERRQLWGAAPSLPVDLFKVFADYIDGGIPRLPWCDNPIQLETVPLKDFLRQMNLFGMLTINSQPRVNGASSSDAAVGWGGPGGYVYQKAYMEFFTSAAHLSKIMKLAAADYPQLSITALNHKGDKVTNVTLGEKLVNAVTWGVFPNREIVQPTVVDVDSFRVWKDEAFALWISQWQPLYEVGSESYELVQTVHDTYYLVNMVDNDYIKGDLFAFFAKIMQ
jgi:methylenetetrahydrofolate reductase (NADPH)